MKKLLEKKWWVLIGVGISAIVVAIDFTIVNTVLPNIQHDFLATMNTLQWVMTGFGITFSSLLVTAGRLGDVFGRRLILYIGILGFGAASLGAGLSSTIDQLVLYRLLQGMFGALVFPCGMAITSNAFKEGEQGKALGIYGGFLGIGLAVGPVLGGLITSIGDWRWIFLLNIPLIAISFLICLVVVEESKIKIQTSIDWLGMFLTSAALGVFVFIVTQGQIYGWASLPIICLSLLTIILLGALFWVERKAQSPLLPLTLFKNRNFFIGVTVFSIGVGFVWPIIFFVPLYLETILGLSVLTTGLLLLPMTATTIIAPPIAGYMYDKQGPFYATMVVFGASFLGLILFLFLSTSLSLSLIIPAFISIGLAWGIANGVALPLILAHPKNKQHEGLVSGAAVTVLNMSAVISLSIASTLFHYVEQSKLKVSSPMPFAFVSGFHAIVIMLLIIASIAFSAVILAFRRKQ